MKYIDTDHLRKEVKRLEKAAHKSALGCADSETRKFHEGKDFAYQHVGILIDSLQQEPIEKDEETEKLIVCDIIEATIARINGGKKNEEKEENIMREKIAYLRDLGLKNHDN